MVLSILTQNVVPLKLTPLKRSSKIIQSILSFVSEFQNVPESELQSKLEHLNHIMSQDWPQDPTMFYAQCKYFDIKFH